MSVGALWAAVAAVGMAGVPTWAAGATAPGETEPCGGRCGVDDGAGAPGAFEVPPDAEPEPPGRGPEGGDTGRPPAVLLPGRLLDEIMRDAPPGPDGPEAALSIGGRGPGAVPAARPSGLEAAVDAEVPVEVGSAGELGDEELGANEFGAVEFGVAAFGRAVGDEPTAPPASAAMSDATEGEALAEAAVPAAALAEDPALPESSVPTAAEEPPDAPGETGSVCCATPDVCVPDTRNASTTAAAGNGSTRAAGSATLTGDVDDGTAPASPLSGVDSADAFAPAFFAPFGGSSG